MAALGAVVLFSSRLEECVTFYSALGVRLIEEEHEGGPVHFACDLGDVHFAIFAADGDGDAPPLGRPGASFLGYALESLDDTLSTLEALGAVVLQEPMEYPWGRRAVVQDPDGRPVEIFGRPR